jgi:peptidoglycan/LPS O-acetylase OafA/YrhL
MTESYLRVTFALQRVRAGRLAWPDMTVGEGATPPAGAALAHRTGDDGVVADRAVDERARPVEGNGNGNGRDPALRLAYNPALDGIRGLAVAAVLLFHGEFAWARGGYLGVSTFFTLSGFLITSLLVVEHHNKGRIGLAAFWGRRVRRLLPAAALTLAVVELAAFATNQAWERAMTGDVVSAALNGANWRFLLDGASYGDLFDPTATSPVLHFWSLAIEEQFYWLFPLLTVGVLALGRGSLRVYGAVLGGMLGVSALLTLQPGLLGIDGPDADVVYYATPIRMGEILVGSLLALVLSRGLRPGRELFDGLDLRLGRLRITRRVAWSGATALGVGALAASAWAWWNVEQDTPFLSDGGLLVYAGLSGLLMLGVCVPGPLRRALAFEPLRLLGVVSYGVYLFHWPVFRLLATSRIDQVLEPVGWQPRGSVLFGLRVSLTLVLAAVSYLLVEQPIRRRRWPGWASRLRRLRIPKLPRLPRLSDLPGGLRRAGVPLLAGGTVGVVVFAAVVVPEVSPPPPDQFAPAEGPALSGPDPATLGPDTRIGVVLGDSTMHRTSWGLSEWGAQANQLVIPTGAAELGCAIGRGGEVEYEGETYEQGDNCAWDESLPGLIDRARDRYGHVDLAVVQTGPWDVANRRVDVDGDGDEEWAHIGQRDYDAWLRDELDAANDLLVDAGLTVLWLTAPPIQTGGAQVPPPDEPYPESDPDRMDRLNEIIRDLADAREGVAVVDLAGYLASLPAGEDARLRPDGVHFDVETTGEVARWLGPELLRTYDAERLR